MLNCIDTRERGERERERERERGREREREFYLKHTRNDFLRHYTSLLLIPKS